MGRKMQLRSSSAAAAAREKEKQKQTEKGGGGRKEKQTGGEQGKEKVGTEVATEGNATAASRIFFKVFFPEQSGERLKIPTSFQEYLVGEPNRQVTLKGPSGNTWEVVLVSDSQGSGFTTGWKEFARDHCLVLGHFLVFTYDGYSQFSVAVLCAAGVEDKLAFNVQPHKETALKLAEEEEGVVDVDVAGTLEVSTPPVDGDGTTRKRLRQVNDVTENGTALKKNCSAQKEPDSSSLLDEYLCYNKTRIRSKDVPRVGQLASKKSRQPIVISQRRPVTEDEKNHALQRAKEFKSKNPFALQIMMESYVYVGFFLTIPCGFVRESLPRTCKKMTLWDPQGKAWDVNYVYYSDRSVAAFSGGWGKFAVGNNLEKFDVCVFELFKEDNIKVHIYRVVQEITPLLRSSSM